MKNSQGDLLERLSKIQKKSEELGGLLSFDFIYSVEQVVEGFDYLLKRFGPFVAGDMVELVKTPCIDEDHAPGWRGNEHLLVKGTKGKVLSVEVYGKRIRALVRFGDGKRRYVNQGGGMIVVGGTFCLGEDYLKKVKDKKKRKG